MVSEKYNNTTYKHNVIAILIEDIKEEIDHELRKQFIGLYSLGTDNEIFIWCKRKIHYLEYFATKKILYTEIFN